MKVKLKTTKTVKLTGEELGKMLKLPGEVELQPDFRYENYGGQVCIGVILTWTEEEEREV